MRSNDRKLSEKVLNAKSEILFPSFFSQGFLDFIEAHTSCRTYSIWQQNTLMILSDELCTLPEMPDLNNNTACSHYHNNIIQGWRHSFLVFFYRISKFY